MKAFLSRLFFSKYLRLAIGLIISGLSLYLALRDVTFDQVWSALSGADWRFTLLTFTTVIISNFAKAARWKVLLGERGSRVKFSQALMSLLAGQALNALYPARIGDLSRAYIVGGMGPGRVFAFGTVIVEKTLDMISYAFLFILLVFLIPLPNWINDSSYSFAGVTFFISAAVFISAWQRVWIVRAVEWFVAYLPTRIKGYLIPRLHSVLFSLEILQSRTELLKLACWTAIIWGISILNNELVLLAFGISLPLTASLLILIALQAGISIPSVPGRIGIFEYICVLALAVFGVGQSTAFGYGVVLHGLVLLTPILAGLVSLSILGLSNVRAALKNDAR